VTIKVAHLASNHSAFDTRIFLKECRTLATNGYEVTFVVPHDADETRDGVRIRAVRSPETRKSRMLRTTWHVFRAALSEKADIYHFHDPELIPFAWLLKLLGKKVIYDVHEDRSKQILSKDWIHPWLRTPVAAVASILDRVSLVLMDRVVVVTPAILNTLRSKKTILVQNFPILDEMRVLEQKTYSSRPPTFAFVGGISRIRGVKEMVIAMSLLPQSLPASLVLAGTFGSSDLERETMNQPGWERVESRGWQSRSQVAQLLANSRAGLVLYYPEPNHVRAQPNKLFEYMSAGIPVIASNFPLWREIVEGARCGLVVDPLRPQEIAEAIQWLLLNSAEAGRMGERGRQAVEGQYNWGPEAEKLLELYSELSR
jgi:glycosyltransferase involved in cell wall biosynthesis